MKEFLISLYENPSFPIYLGAVILVLVIAFFVIFFLGKRDQKNIEKTQRLEAIHDNAFSETTVPVQMNVAPQVVTNEQSNRDLNNTISETPVQNVQVPEVEEQNPLNVYNVNTEPVQQNVIEQPAIVQESVIQTPVVEQPVVAPAVEPIEPVIQPPIIEQPVIAPVVEQTVQTNEVVYPTIDNNYESIDQKVDNQIDNLQNIANSISNELDSLQEEQNKYYSMTSEPIIEQPVVSPEPVVQTPVIEQPVIEEYQPAHARPFVESPSIEQQPISTPVVEETQSVVQSEPIRNNYSTNNVFSSVYAPPKVEQPVVEDTDEDEIDLPRLK